MRGTPPGRSRFFGASGKPLADGAPAGDDLIAFKAHGEELVRKERVGEGEVGTDMVGAGFLPRQRGVHDRFAAVHEIEHFGGPHERMRTRRAHLPFRGMAELLQVIPSGVEQRFGTHLAGPAGA